jgi:KDO2-lipid IV(A) lauroyltransferase
VRKNLVNAFPDKDLKEIIKIEKGFYAFFCDYAVETLKMLTMSEKEMRRRMTYEGLVEAEKAMTESGKSCILYLGHYCNWEWVTSIPMHLNNEAIVRGHIYHPLENKFFDNLFLKIRSRFGSENISMNATLRRIVNIRRKGKQFMIGFISDQTPEWDSIRYWTNFMNQDTPVFSGTERIARQTESLVYYLNMTRPKRGYYHGNFILMTAEPQNLPENALTDMYFQLLEESIRHNPQYWLWSHNRWKRQRKDRQGC